jgi:hypothetical protein
MKEAVRDFLRTAGVAGILKNPALYRAWERVVPAQYRPFTRLAGLKNKAVTVEVSSAAVLQELAQFGKEKLRQALVREMGGLYIANVRLVLADFGRGDERGVEI